ncbi:Fpg/Nei family DNA glycosylase [Streptomyces sp. XM4193]|uniref:Fpg/Nei family DNA glycosylase n=1 Tax=Streptomyces sp. XM4193 TaxID=2929782 RepID=UPI001FF94443|nr:DNA-formamidopyrimidine glycosylase family protein [Streptomyces sp. XM4193]MCK1795841.1 Fpg/Nei family DNA glycosylase [Streptomyces sp. XM4193]
MPEGHTIHRLAADHRERFRGERLEVSSPQGRFAESAALLDGRTLETAEAVGKHLFLGFSGSRDSSGSTTEPAPVADWVHIHLGLFGRLDFGVPPVPEPADTVRLRLVGSGAYADLRGPTRCALVTDAEKRAAGDRLGPDPLRGDADGSRAWERLSRSRTSIAALLLDQKVLAGVGNVYRAEVLFRHGVDPYRAGRTLRRHEWDALWADLVDLMRIGVRENRIDTVRPEHTPEAMGRPPRVDDHGGEVYVYRRTGLPCLVCSTPVRTAELGARNLFWCPRCQPPAG